MAAALLRGNIKKRMDARQVTNEQMAAALGIHPGTFAQKTNHPGRFTYPELVAVFEMLGFTDNEILESMKEDTI